MSTDATPLPAEPCGSVPADPGRRRWPKWAVVAAWCLLVGKLVLISHDEIVTQAADDYNFAVLGARWYFTGEYGKYTHTRQPGYPLFLALSAALGMPVRLAIEAVLAIAAAIVARAMGVLGVRAPLALLAFGLVLWCPWTLHMNSRLIVDTFYAPVFTAMILALAAAAAARGRQAWLWGALAGVLAAIAANTRPESILVLASIGIVALCAAVLVRRTGFDPRSWRFAAACRIAAAAILPLAMVVASTQAIKSVHQRLIGAAVTYDLALPGYKSLYRALLEIRPATPQPIINPISSDVLAQAFTASPTFARLQGPLESDPGVLEYQRTCEKVNGLQGEYGVWIVWAIRHAAWVENQHRWTSAGQIDALYAEAAQELRAAMRDGRLPRRLAPFTFIPPQWRDLFAAAPAAAAKCWSVLTVSRFGRHHPSAFNDDVPAVFDASALRRAPLIRDPGTGQRPPPRSAWHADSVAKRLDAVQRRVVSFNAPLVYGSALLAMIGVIAGLVRRRTVDARWWLAMLIIAAAVAARFALVVALEVSGMPAQPRYLLPCVMLLSVAGVLGIHLIGRALAGLRVAGPPTAPDTTPPCASAPPPATPAPATPA